MGHGRPIPLSQSMALHRLIIQVQNQCKNLNEYLRLNEFMLLFECIASSTTLAFLLTHIDWNTSANVAVRLHWSFYVFSLLTRMFWKGWLAEQIGDSVEFLKVWGCATKWLNKLRAMFLRFAGSQLGGRTSLSYRHR